MRRPHLHHFAVVFLVTLLNTDSHAVETGTSHNLFILNRLTDDSFFVGRGNLVTRDGFSDTFFGYADINYRHKLSAPWAIEVGYRQAYLEIGNRYREEYRPMLSLYWFGTLFDGKFSNRHRIEWRSFEGTAPDRTRYRNESVWRSKSTITDLKLIPFIEEEFFYDITDSDLNSNWVTVGVSKFWSKKIKWKLGYRLSSNRSNNDWDHRHMLVTGISFLSFD